MVPAVGFRAPVIIRIVVVLPDPEGPMTPRIVPVWTTRLSPSTAVSSPNRIVASCTTTAA
jgi:hypothetical protein